MNRIGHVGKTDLPIILLAASLIATGCASTHSVDSGQAEKWIPAAQEQLLGKSVSVETTDGRTFSGTLEMLSVDSLGVQDNENDKLVAWELGSISYFGTSRSIAGPLIGGLFGMFFGAAVGTAVTHTDSDDPLRSLSRAAGGATGATLGTIIGAGFGGYVTRADQYQIRPTPHMETDFGQ